jgi:hypothetical protein
MTMETAVARGLKDECARLARSMLERRTELELVNEVLIPALDKVGEGYERGELFLPQLINAANASCAAFEVIKQRILERGARSVSKGKILLATVQGDIHDIGKNIVRVILENYGYQVVDLGRDVAPERVVKLCRRFFEGDLAGAAKDQLTLLPLIQALFSQTNPIPAKAALARLGMIEDRLRLPLTPMEEPFRGRLYERMAELGLL